jgi:hypothetical protein
MDLTKDMHKAEETYTIKTEEAPIIIIEANKMLPI